MYKQKNKASLLVFNGRLSNNAITPQENYLKIVSYRKISHLLTFQVLFLKKQIIYWREPLDRYRNVSSA